MQLNKLHIALCLSALLSFSTVTLASTTGDDWADTLDSQDTPCDDTISCLQTLATMTLGWYKYRIDEDYATLDESSASASIINPVLHRDLRNATVSEAKKYTDNTIKRLLLRTTADRTADADEISAYSGSDTAVVNGKNSSNDCGVLLDSDGNYLTDWDSTNAKISCSGNENYDYGSIINPTVYSSEQEAETARHAFKLIFGFSNMAVHYKNWDSETVDALKNNASSPDLRDYSVAFRNYVTALSPVISYYSQLMAERTPIGGLISNPDDAGDIYVPEDHASSFKYYSEGKASPLEFEEYVATRRTRYSDWYFKIAEAPLGAVAREMAYELAELQAQMYLVQRAVKDMTAQLSLITLNGISQNAGTAVDSAQETAFKIVYPDSVDL